FVVGWGARGGPRGYGPAICAGGRAGATASPTTGAGGPSWDGRLWGLGRSLVRPADRLHGRLDVPEGEQIDPHSVTIPLRPGREYGVFDPVGRISHRKAHQAQVFFDLALGCAGSPAPCGNSASV